MKRSNKMLIIALALIVSGVFFMVYKVKTAVNSALSESGVVVDNPGISGVQAEKRYEIGAFERLVVNGSVVVKMIKSDTDKVVLRGDSMLLNFVEIEQRDQKLAVGLTKIKGRKIKVEVDIYTTNMQLTKISVNAGARLTSDETISSSDLDIDVNAGARIGLHVNCTSVACSSNAGAQASLTGSTTKFLGSANAGATIKAKNLKAKKVEASANAGAHVTVYASEVLEASCLAGGHVTYFGNPVKVDKSTLAGGRLQKGD